MRHKDGQNLFLTALFVCGAIVAAFASQPANPNEDLHIKSRSPIREVNARATDTQPASPELASDKSAENPGAPMAKRQEFARDASSSTENSQPSAIFHGSARKTWSQNSPNSHKPPPAQPITEGDSSLNNPALRAQLSEDPDLYWAKDYSGQLGENAFSGNSVAATGKSPLVTLPIATIGEKYCESLAKAAKISSDSAKAESGILPPGLALNPADSSLCGMPTAGGVFTFTVLLLTDFAGKSLPFRLVVQESPASNDSSDSELRLLSTSPPKATVGESYFFQLRAEGGTPPYIWQVTGLPEGLILDAPTGVIGGRASEEGEFALSITLRDSSGKTITAQSSLLVSGSPLHITTSSIEPAVVGALYSFTFLAQGGTPPYSWQILSGILPQGLVFSPALGRISGSATKSGKTKLRVRASDAGDQSDSVELEFSVEDSELEITDDTLPAPVPGEVYRYALKAKGGTPPYLWSIAAGSLPEGLVISAAGLISGVPSTLQAPFFVATVEDTTKERSSKKLFFANQAEQLTISTTSLPAAHSCTEYSFSLRAAGGLPPYNWSLSGGTLPEGLLLSSLGEISGTPSTATNSFPLIISLADSDKSITQRNFLLNLSLPPLTARKLSAPYFASKENEIVFNLEAEGGCPPYVFSLTSPTLPEGLVLSASGVISGKTELIGKFSVLFRVSDSLGQLADGSLALHIGSGDFTINPASLPTGKAGEEFSFSLSALGGEPPYLWSVAAGALPEGVSLLPASGLITGVPEGPGAFEFIIAASDALGAIAKQAFSIEVSPVPLEIIFPGQLPFKFTPGQTFEARIEARGGLKPYTWTYTNQNLPLGLDLFLGEEVLLRGSIKQSESYQIPLTVRDSSGTESSDVFVLEATESSLRILSESPLPSVSGEHNMIYSQLSAQGGEPPYHWSLVSSSADGFAVDHEGGVLSGPKPSAGEEIVLLIRLADSQEGVVEKEFSLVDEETLPPVSRLLAQASDAKVGLAWTAPKHPLFSHVAVIKNTSKPPMDYLDGELVYSGTASNILDSAVVNGETYHYAAFAAYQMESYSEAPDSARSTATPAPVALRKKPDICADAVSSFSPLDPGNTAGASRLPAIVLGLPQGGGENFGASDVVSLHSRINNDNSRSAPYGGSIVVEFTDNIVTNGPGADFTVFENAFRVFGTSTYWIEPAVIDVSIDGETFHRFPFDFVPHYHDDGTLNLHNPQVYARGFAGVRPVFSANGTPDPRNPTTAGGDAFDLSALPGQPFSWIRFVRITATGDNWLSDQNGDKVRHSHQAPSWGASGTGNSGFDLDAVCAINY